MAGSAAYLSRPGLVRKGFNVLVAISALEHRAVDRGLKLDIVHIETDQFPFHVIGQGRVIVTGQHSAVVNPFPAGVFAASAVPTHSSKIEIITMNLRYRITTPLRGPALSLTCQILRSVPKLFLSSNGHVSADLICPSHSLASALQAAVIPNSPTVSAEPKNCRQSWCCRCTSP